MELSITWKGPIIQYIHDVYLQFLHGFTICRQRYIILLTTFVITHRDTLVLLLDRRSSSVNIFLAVRFLYCSSTIIPSYRCPLFQVNELFYGYHCVFPARLKFRGEANQKIQNPWPSSCTNSYVASCKRILLVVMNESFHGQSVLSGHVLCAWSSYLP